MQSQLKVYNTLTRQHEIFAPLQPPLVGMYLCGPTVYGPPHLGHARSAIAFDVVYRYLQHLGYQVRYIRNMTDVGHLTNNAEEGEDKIIQQARLEQRHPMAVAQQYINQYHWAMEQLQVQKPCIEPRASGHIIAQISLIQHLLKAGFAYPVNGSVYFDIAKYAQHYTYGELSGRKMEDLLAGTRALQQQAEKKNPFDFALWKKAVPHHSMHWPSPWGRGFPGWHLECTAMSAHYLGTPFDIHAGGIDLCFPHHECEIAQSQVAYATQPARYWLHNNLVTLQGQKMGKSLGNAITLSQIFQGNHPLLDQSYSPMTLRFFILQAHYRSTLSFSTQALQAAQKGYRRLINGLHAVQKLVYTSSNHVSRDEALVRQIQHTCTACTAAMNDDFNTAKTIAQLFELLKHINALQNSHLLPAVLGESTFEQLKHTYITFVEKILGLQEDKIVPVPDLINIVLDAYQIAKAKKDYDRVAVIRTQMKRLGIALQDKPQGIAWAYEG